MKLRTIRRNLQTRIESTWLRLRSRFVDVEKLSQEIPDDVSIGVMVLAADDQSYQKTIDSVESQFYRAFTAYDPGPDRMQTMRDAARQNDYLAIVDRHVILEPDALLWAAMEIKNRPRRPDWIYFDHIEPIDLRKIGIIGTDGRRRTVAAGRGDVETLAGGKYHGVFKPEFSPEYLLTGMFAGGFNVFRSEAVLASLEAIADSDCECLQYEIALRLHEGRRPTVVRIPQIAYTNECVEPYEQVEPQRLAAERHLHRRGVDATVDVICAAPTVLSPKFRSCERADVTVLIPTRNQLERVKKCVEGVRSTTGDNVHIRMIDNQSDDPALFEFYEAQRSLGRFDVESFAEPFNYARMHNVAIDKIESEFVVLLNNDVLDFSDDWVGQLIGTARLSEDIGCVGTLLRFPDGMTQHGGVSFGIGRPCRHIHLDISADSPGYCGRLQAMQQLSALTAALLLVRRSVFSKLGGFDEIRYPISYNDTDLCLKMRSAGYRAIYNPRITAIHEESVSRGRSPLEKKWRSDFIRQWTGEIESDPFYNPHLSKREYAVDRAAFQAWRERKRVSLESTIRAA